MDSAINVKLSVEAFGAAVEKECAILMESFGFGPIDDPAQAALVRLALGLFDDCEAASNPQQCG